MTPATPPPIPEEPAPPVAGEDPGAWWRRAGPVTRAVALACALVFAAELAAFPLVLHWLAYPEVIDAAALRSGWWRLFTPALLHFGWLHLVFNLLWWWEFGGQVEVAQGGARLLVLALVVAVASNAVQSLTYGAHFGGLSAVVYGVFGYLWLYPLANPRAPWRLARGVVVLLLGWLALGYSGLPDWLFGINVSNHGHLAGLVAGGLMGLGWGGAERRWRWIP